MLLRFLASLWRARSPAQPGVASRAAEPGAIGAAIAAFREGDARAAALLKAARRDLAARFAALGESEAGREYASAGETVRALMASGLRDLPRDAEDERAAGTARAKGGAPGARVAQMLLHLAHELEAPDLAGVPGWLFADYAAFILAEPPLFQQPGESERYRAYLEAAVKAVRDYVFAPAAPRREELLEIFMHKSRFIQAYFNEGRVGAIFRARAELIEAWALSRGAPLAHLPGARRAGPLRVGLLQLHFAPQTETYFMLAHFGRFPRERCSLRFYALSERKGALPEHARASADEMVQLSGTSIAADAARIRADDLDVLLIGSNVTATNSDHVVLAACRLARVQAITASSPVTSGLTSADAFLAAELNGTVDADHTEKVYRMRGMLSRYAYDLDRDAATLAPTRRELGIPEDALVFFSGANYFKILPELSRLWARIVAKTPGAWLMLMPYGPNWSTRYLAGPFRARILREIEAAGGDPARVTIQGPAPARADVHAFLRLADVYLDSYPFAGACSLLDPIEVALPVVARSGPTFRGGVGVGMLRGLGLGDMAAADEAAYEQRALALGADPALREKERARMRAAITPSNPVFDSATGSRDMEEVVVAMANDAAALEAAIGRQSAAWLEASIGRLAGDLAAARNPWFGSLTDLELIRLVAGPYFGSAPGRMLDVGACLGEMSRPFLERGWMVDWFEPDPECAATLRDAAARFPGRARLHAVAVSDEGGRAAFHRSAVGLSGLGPSPYGERKESIEVPVVRLDRYCEANGFDRVDFLKVDVEGYDLRALLAHDFARRPPRLAMAEFGTEFAGQDRQAIEAAIRAMDAHGYGALVLSYEDHGNFARQVWRYQLISAAFGKPATRADGHASGNILFYRRGDTAFLATVFRLLLSFLPPVERNRYLGAIE